VLIMISNILCLPSHRPDFFSTADASSCESLFDHNLMKSTRFSDKLVCCRESCNSFDSPF
jgi:hypothetical protein